MEAHVNPSSPTPSPEVYVPESCSFARRAVWISIVRRAASSSFGMLVAFFLCSFVRAAFADMAQGTSTTSNTRFTICSAVTSSVSASYVSTTRWRRTSGPIAFTSSGVT